MNQPQRKFRFIVRYIYGLMAILVMTAVTALIIMYVIQDADRSARERFTVFHAKSSVLAGQLFKSNQLILQQVIYDEEAAIGAAPSSSSFLQPVPDVQATFRTMFDRVERLQVLQEQYGGDEFIATLQRVATRLVAAEQALKNSPPSTSIRGELLTLDLAIQQFYRQHVIATVETVDDIDAFTGRARPLLIVIFALLVIAGLITWMTARQLRISLDRQTDIEEALAESNERMHHMQKLEAIGQLVGGVAHDFNNLLTAILGHTGLLLDRPSDDDYQKASLTQIKKAGQQAATLTRQLLAFSRPEAVEMRVFNVNDLIQDIEDMLRRLIGEHVELSVRYANNLSLVEMDPGQLQQVVLNLAINACDAMRNGGQLSIVTSNAEVGASAVKADAVPAGRYVLLVVSDTGVGMDKRTSDRMFEPYFSTKPKDRGTGLGLSTVHGIITAANGHIRVDSQPGSGSRFEIYLHATDKPADTDANKPALAQKSGGSETVLIVEDEEQILSFLKEGLGSLGYRVLTAPNADVGLQLCRSERGSIDVIVTDVIMPQTNGVEFLQQAQQLQPSATGIFMSGYTDDILLHSGVDASEATLITKPFELFELANLIRQRLDKTHT